MAIKAFNSIAGFSVGEVASNVILANGDVTSNNGTFTANISAGNVKTDNLLYANGTPWDLQLPGGSNTFVQFNDSGDLGGNANFTFNKSTSVLTVTGNIAATNINAGNLLTANFTTAVLTTSAQPNITSVGTLTSLVVGNSTANVTLTDTNGNGFMTVTGNVTAANFIGNVVGNISGNIVIPGSNTGVVFNDAGNANTSTAFTFNKSSNVVTASGNISAGNLITSGNVQAENIVNPTASTSIGMGNGSGIVAIYSAGNATQFLPSGQINLGGVSQIKGGTFTGSYITLGTSQTDIAQDRGGNVTVQVGTGGTIANTWTFAQNGSFTSPGNITTSANANVGNLNTLGNANIGNLVISGNVQGNLIPSSANTYNLGNATNYWKDLFLSGTTITLGTQTISANAGGVSLSNTAFMANLTVSGNANVGNLGTGGLIVATGNVTGGNITTAGLVSATGNVTGGNITTAGLVSATGNVTGGNITTAGVMAASGNIISNANVVTDLIVGRTTGVTITATGTNQNVNLVPTGTGTVNVGNFIISNLATPNASSDAATKQYVDEIAQGLSPKGSVVLGSTVALPAYTYNNGTLGVGATITATAVGALSLDGTQPVPGQRVLIKNETAGYAPVNGIYVVTVNTVGSAFILTRASDMNTGPEFPGSFIFIESGSTLADTGWVCTTDSPVTVGTTAIVFTQFSGAGQYAAGTGLTLTGTTFSITNTTVSAGSYGNGDYNATFTVNGQGQLTAAANVALTPNAANLSGTTLNSAVVTSSLTSVGTLTSLAVTGNTTSGNVYANAGTIGAANLTGTLTTAAQPNITSVGSLSSLTVTGTTNLGAVGNVTITGGTSGYVLQTNGSGGLSWVGISTSSISNGTSNIAIPSVNGNVNLTSAGNTTLVVTGTGANIAGSLNVTGNLVAGNLTTGGAGGNISGANNVSANTLTGNLTTNAQPNITSIGSLTGLTVSNAAGVVDFTTTANVTLGAVANLHISGGTNGYYLQTNGSGALTWASIPVGSGISNGTSNVTIPVVNGNISLNSAGNTTLTVTGTGANIAGTLNATGNANVGNIGATGGVFTTVAGNLTTNAQPNVTSVGSLTGLTVSNASGVVDFTTTANVTLGAVANVHITGGSSGYVLSTNGSGGLSWIAISSSSISNGTSNVSIPAVNGNVNISSAGNTTMVVTNTGANIDGYANITGTLSLGGGTGGNLTGANNINANTFTGVLTTAAQPNVTSLGTLTGLTVNGTTNLGAVGNVTITGGSGGYVLSTNGSGGLSWIAINSSGISNGTSNISIPVSNGNVNVTSGGNTTMVVTGTGANITGSLNVSNTVVSNAGVSINNSAIYTSSLTTTSITANQTIATLALTSSYVTAVEYLVKGVDLTGTKYSVATVMAVTNGTISDFSTFGVVNIGGGTGALAVNISGSNIALQVTPTSSNSTVWTTQFRVI